MKNLTLVGGFGNTIEVFELDVNEADSTQSKLVHKESCVVDEKPAFLHVEDEKIYCVHEVSSFKGEQTGGLSFLKIGGVKVYNIQSQFSCGEDPCHIIVNPAYNCAYISNYLSGHFAVTKVKNEGLLGGGLYIESYDKGSGVDLERQETSHPHGACFKDKHVYVVDLGADKIWHYEHGEGNDFHEGTPVSFDTPPGSGPRHMVFHHKYDLAFLLTELSNEVIVYKYNNGNLEKLSSYKYLSHHQEGKNYGAEIDVHPNGEFLYLSNRVNGSITSYKICDSSGKLEKIECFDTVGTWPRHFGIDPSGNVLLCADQFKNLLEVLSVDRDTGKLKRIQTIDCKNQPSCVVFSKFATV